MVRLGTTVRDSCPSIQSIAHECLAGALRTAPRRVASNGGPVRSHSREQLPVVCDWGRRAGTLGEKIGGGGDDAEMPTIAVDRGYRSPKRSGYVVNG